MKKISDKIHSFYESNKVLAIFAGVGIFLCAKQTCKLVKYSYNNGFRRRKNFKKEYGGDWAMITGASAGLGKAYSQQMAAEGYNLILISRNAQDLDILVQELIPKHEIKIKPIVFDFDVEYGKDTERILTPISKAIEEEDVSILINNLGIGFLHEFASLSYSDILAYIRVNILSTVLMTRLLLPHMLNRKQKSGIINVSSGGSIGKLPYFQMYAGTKSFIDSFTRALNCEYKHKIDFLTINPGPIDTKMLARKTPFTISASEAAKWHLNKLGHIKESRGHWIHDLHFIINYILTPQWLRNSAIKHVLKKQKKNKQ